MKEKITPSIENLEILLRSYSKQYPEEAVVTADFMTLIQEDGLSCFSRNNLNAHLTGSAFICSTDYSMILLTHHAKLGIWVQPGGHADGDTDLLRVSRKEAEEETGLNVLTQEKLEIFDLDIHRIPEYKGIPTHLHYDVRFLFTADSSHPLIITEESRDLRWFFLNQVSEVTQEESILRMIRKIRN